jgi:hypothetical protein
MTRNLTTLYSYLKLDGKDLKVLLIVWLMKTMIDMMIGKQSENVDRQNMFVVSSKD